MPTERINGFDMCYEVAGQGVPLLFVHGGLGGGRGSALFRQHHMPVLAQYAHEHPDLLKEIDQNLVKLDGVLDKLDHRLADSLAKAHQAKDDAARSAELKNAKVILADYIKYVKSEPLIAHIDANPFGVNTNLKKVLSESLTHMAQSIG